MEEWDFGAHITIISSLPPHSPISSTFTIVATLTDSIPHLLFTTTSSVVTTPQGFGQCGSLTILWQRGDHKWWAETPIPVYLGSGELRTGNGGHFNVRTILYGDFCTWSEL